MADREYSEAVRRLIDYPGDTVPAHDKFMELCNLYPHPADFLFCATRSL